MRYDAEGSGDCWAVLADTRLHCCVESVQWHTEMLLQFKSHCSAPPGNLRTGFWKGSSDQFLKVRLLKNIEDSVLAVEQWTGSLSPQGFRVLMGVCPSRLPGLTAWVCGIRAFVMSHPVLI